MKNSFSSFQILKYSKTVSQVGTCLRLIIWPLQAFLLTKDPSIIPIILAVEQITETIFSMFSGYLADRFNRKAIIIIDDIISGLCSFSLCLLTATTIWWCIPISIVWSISNSLSLNSKELLLNDIKGSDDTLRTQLASYDLPLNVVGIFTILIGSFIVEYVGLRPVFIFDAITFFVCAFFICFIKYKPELSQVKFPTFRSKLNYFVEGHKYVTKENKWLLSLCVITGLFMIAQGLTSTSHIQFLKTELGSSDLVIGFWRFSIRVAFLIGSYILLNKYIKKISNTKILLLSIFMMIATYSVFTASNNQILFLIIMCLNSIGLYFFQTSVKAEAISLATKEMQARANTYRIFIANATYAIGQIISIWTIQLPGTGRINYFSAFIIDLFVLAVFAILIYKKKRAKLYRMA